MAFRSLAHASHRVPRGARIALLWLALVMAIAQTVAFAHAYSHSPGESAPQSAGKHPGGLAHCHACIAAAAVGGAAPPASTLLLPAAEQQAPQVFAATGEQTAPQHRRHAIRAPPFTSC